MTKSRPAAGFKSKALTTIEKCLIGGALCLLLLPGQIFAKTLAAYRENLENAGESVAELLDYVDDNLAGGERNLAYERAVLAEIRAALPATEKIEWEGTSLETGNLWLAEKLKAFETESIDWPQRRLILDEVDERISALESTLAELENPAVSERSKDEDKRKLAEILRREEYQKPEPAGESWFEKLQRRIREWFNEKFPRPDLPPGATSGLQSASVYLQILLYVAILGLIGFLIYRFAPFLAQKFRRRHREGREERVILGEKLAAHENAQSLFGDAEALAKTGNLRGAIRKGYIALLCELSDRSVIGLARHKTNRDYLRDVRRQPELYQNLSGLTRNYERHWYGFEDADEADWHEFKSQYQKAIGSAG
jgi:hypothetical protein